jgi:hypothetical protein
MSTALVTALRESCGYLEDDGYHQTARMMTAAADEIERLNERVRVLEMTGRQIPAREPMDSALRAPKAANRHAFAPQRQR